MVLSSFLLCIVFNSTSGDTNIDIGARQRHGDTDTQRHRDTETETQRQRHRDRDTETQRHRDRDRETQRHRNTETQRQRQVGKFSYIPSKLVYCIF